MSIGFSATIRDVAIEKINKRIDQYTAELICGAADDFAEYRSRIGVITGLQQALLELDDSFNLVMGTNT